MTEPTTVSITPTDADLANPSSTDPNQTRTGPGQSTETGDKPERPAWLPEKFKTPEDMATAYAELERKQSAPQDDKGLGIPKPDAKPEPGPADAFAQATQEFNQTGQLTDATIARLDKAGVPAEVVQQHIAGLRALGQQIAEDVYRSVGGRDRYAEITAWASSSLPENERAAMDRMLTSGDAVQARTAAIALQARFAAAGRSEPSLATGSAPTGGGNQVFKTEAEMLAAMSDPRYATDADFRRQVARRIPDDMRSLKR
jgi:Phage T7 capsid assembly protein